MTTRRLALILLIAGGCASRHAARSEAMRDAGAPDDERVGDAGQANRPRDGRPFGLTASRDDPDVVVLRWRAPLGFAADGYSVLRDGVPIVRLSADARDHLDRGALPGEVAAVELEASEGTRSDGVELRWVAAESAPGPAHEYAVLALYGERASEPSEPASGSRAAPRVEGYELCREPCERWQALGDTLEHLDQDAPLARLDAGRADALAFIAPEAAVRLAASEAQVEPVREHYRVRAVAGAVHGPPSPPASGYRSGGVLHYQWQRAEAAEPETFSDLPGVTGISWLDAKAPLDTTLRYRARMQGEGTEAALTEPAAVHTVRPVARIAASPEHTCVLFDSGELRCFGGVGNPESRVPESPAPERFIDVSVANSGVGGTNAGTLCAIEEGSGRLRCWGSAVQLGLSSPPLEFLTQDSGTPLGYRKVSASPGDVCAIRAVDGIVDCFADGGPAQQTLGMGAFVDVAADGRQICGVSASDGALQCVGTGASFAPKGAFTALSLRNSACALRAPDQHAVCWDQDDVSVSPLPLAAVSAGGCGVTRDGGEIMCRWDEDVPQMLPGSGYSALAGAFALCAVDGEGRVRCFGDDDHGHAPRVPFETPFVAVAGGAYPCALDADGAVACLPLRRRHVPELPPGDGYRALAVGERSRCALDRDGLPLCWGRPLDDLPSQTAFAAIASYGRLFCGLQQQDGALRCWGELVDTLFPLREPTGSGHTALAVGIYHACVLDSEGHMRCFGDNAGGNAPAGPSVERYAAISAAGWVTCGIELETERLRCFGHYGVNTSELPAGGEPEGRFNAVAADLEHVCALRSEDGRIVCWGEAGLPESLSRASYSALSAGGGATCALRASDRKLVCWGKNHYGQSGEPVVLP